MECYRVGLDLGLKKDFTAMAVVQPVERRGAFDAMIHAYRKETKLVVRTVKREPLGTPYTEWCGGLGRRCGIRM
jgi:phage terminase large subunit-like protein